MDIKELSDALNTVFEIEIQDLDAQKGTFKVCESVDEPILYPHAETLIQLYANIRNNEKLRTIFLDTLKNGIINSECYRFGPEIYRGISSLCFYTLVRAGHAKEAIAALKKRKKYCEGIFNIIIFMLTIDYFDSTQLGDILLKTRESIKSIEWPNERSSSKAVRLEDIIVNLRYAFLHRKISRINIEINEDKRALSEKMDLLVFGPQYNELLDGIDNFINTETEQFINSGLISNLRAFIADLLKDIAYRIAEKEQEAIPALPNHGEMGNIRKYLQDKLDYSEKDDKFVTTFIDILHSEGGHSFTSEKEYFRLARNIAIEIALFVLSKYEKKYA